METLTRYLGIFLLTPGTLRKKKASDRNSQFPAKDLQPSRDSGLRYLSTARWLSAMYFNWPVEPRLFVELVLGLGLVLIVPVEDDHIPRRAKSL